MSNEVTRFCDREFFTEQLNLDFNGMEKVKSAVESGDFALARSEYAEFIRNNLQPERYFSIPYEKPENDYMFDGETDLEAAERICDRVLISCGTPCKFDGEVDWHSNATENDYCEWPWQLSRHHEWKLLGYVYRQTGNEKYAEKCAEFFRSWVKQAVNPDIMPKYGWSCCWRTIECGIRMHSSWPYALHSFYKSPAFDDDILVDWAKSTCEHGHKLHDEHKDGNWLIMEMNGLAQLSMIFPEFKKSGEWLKFAFDMMTEELEKQFYPDGFQYELSTNYHEVVLANYHRLMNAANAYDVIIPQKFLSALENATALYVKLIMPDGALPDLNDGNRGPVAKFLTPKLSLFPNREDFKWAASGGKEGKAPDYTSITLPYSGFSVMRSGWDKDDVYAIFDAAPFGRGHQHEDKLSLLMYAHGKLILTEGGNYAYDESEMRHYVLSTRAHNTVLVDGKDQNRRDNYTWATDDIKKLSGMKYKTEESFDFAEGVYDEGYGNECDRSVTHKRSVYFIKSGVGSLSSPVLIAVDRMYSESEHSYESLWHLDTASCDLTDGKANADGLSVFFSANEAEVINGQEAPEWQGWIADSFRQGDFRAINTLVCKACGDNVRTVTVFDTAKKSAITAVRASKAVGDTEIVIELSDGNCITLDEKGFGYCE